MLNALRTHHLRYHLARAARWVTYDENGEAWDALPPPHVLWDMLAHPDPPLPSLDRIVGCPVFTTDGRLLLNPGYHAEARIYYAPPPGLVIPPVAEAPTVAEIARARGLFLDDLLVDFPFVGDRKQSPERAHAVALGLLPFARELIPGPTPLHLVEKPRPGTGAGLLVRVLGRIALGRPPAVMAPATNEEEWRKRLTSLLVEGAEIVIIDNLPVRGRLDSASLSAAITSRVFRDRILGLTKTAEVPVRCVWVATGNNPTLSTELARRSVRIRLDAKLDRPWRRKPEDFKHPDLDTWVADHPGELIWATLTLIQAWLAAGRPAGRVGFGEFEAWACVMGGILDVAGIPGFLGNLEEFYEVSDTEGAETRTFLSAWWDKYQSTAVGVKELFEIAVGDGVGLNLGRGNERSQRTRLGSLLRDGLRDQRFTLDKGLVVQVVPAGERKNALLWKLVPCDEDEGERDKANQVNPEVVNPENSSETQEISGSVNLANLPEPPLGGVNPFAWASELLASTYQAIEIPGPSGTSPVRVVRTPLIPQPPAHRKEGV